jgi:hypothetical protein
MLLALSLALAAETVPAVIEQWRKDLREEFGVTIPIVWVGRNVEGDPEGMDLAARQLAGEAFRAQFRLMQAATITEEPPGGPRIAVLMNEAWRPSWSGHEAALLGHEFGHVWLRLRRLPAPAYSGGATACLAVHTGDIVQHVLIRAELDRRNIDHKTSLMKSMDEAAAAMKHGSAARDSCAAARQTAIWVDSRLGLKWTQWPGREEYEAVARRLFPEAEEPVNRIIALLDGKDLNDRFVHRQALVDVFAELRRVSSLQPRAAPQ